MSKPKNILEANDAQLYIRNKSSTIVQSLLTPKNSFKIFEQKGERSSTTSSTQSLKGLMNSTTSTNNTLPGSAAPEIALSNKKLTGSKIYGRERSSLSTNSISNIRANSGSAYKIPKRKTKPENYNETFGKEMCRLLGNKSTVNDLLKDSVKQRKDFVDEIEGRLKGLKTDKVTPTFKNITKEDIKTFNFEKELERLKKTLVDIKDQECRFIKLLSRQSPRKMNKSQPSTNRSEVISPARSIELMYLNEDPDYRAVEINKAQHRTNSSQACFEPNYSKDMGRFGDKFESYLESDILQDHESEDGLLHPYGASYDKQTYEKADTKPNDKFKQKRKSSLKKRNPADSSDYNSGSTQSIKSR